LYIGINRSIVFQEISMPTYEYECTKCGHTFEIIQSMSAPALTKCPKCKGRIRRIIGGGMGVIFKGSGFYSTDNKKGSVLTGGNGSSSNKEKTPEKPKEPGPEKSTSEKSPSEKSSSEKSAK
jgi:putative FmdB family regulatory protein